MPPTKKPRAAKSSWLSLFGSNQKPRSPLPSQSRFFRRPGMPAVDLASGKRLEFILGIFMLAFVVLAIRSLDLALVQGSKLRERAESQYKKRVVVPANRGRFLDRRGTPLAVSLPVKTLNIDIDRMGNPTQLARQLAPLIDMPEDRLAQKLRSSKPGSYPVLKRKIAPDMAERILALDSALYFTPEMQRFYPIGEVAAHVLGFVDIEGKGVEGLERSFNKILEGKSGLRVISHDRMGRPMTEAKTIDPTKPGLDVVLTIDSTIQYIAYRALLKSVTQHQAKAGMAMAMDPRDGRLLAMVSIPSYNPNNLADSKAESRRNRNVTDAYEPGSTFKIFTVGTALDLGVVNPDTRFDVEHGRFRLADVVIRDTHKEDLPMTVTQILQKSSNIGAAKIGLQTGHTRQLDYLQRFGFGKATNLGFTYEASGRLPDITHYVTVGLANRSFGQGISVTPLQIITAGAAIVNGGLLPTARLVEGVIRDGQLLAKPQPDPVRVMKTETSRTMRHILAGVVGPEGTAPQAAIEGYTVGGKTGTAQKASPTGGYGGRHYFSSFMGFVPVETPRLIMYVAIDEPQGLYYGGQVAAPVFREVAQEALPMLAALPEIPVDNPMPPIEGYVFDPERKRQEGFDALIGSSLGEALEILRGQGIIPRVTGSGLVARHFQNDQHELVLELK
ncbi:MAG: penicillin-binding protein 2 [Magnetococcales bacterium]|nr:penicillin-binding protein 2 [Magnetococcales bacterium]